MKLSTKMDTYSRAIRSSAGCFTGIGVLIVTMAASRWIYALLEYLVINHACGHAAWLQGVHVVNKRGDLSNGDILSGWSYVILFFGTFLLTALFFLSSYFLFGYIGLRLSGRRLNDPPPKKKWVSSEKQSRTARRD